MSENTETTQDAAPAPESNAAPQPQPQPQAVDPFTILFNAVEIANRRGAYSLRESGVISRALDVVRQATTAGAPAPAAPAAPESAEPATTEVSEEPSIESS